MGMAANPTEMAGPVREASPAGTVECKRAKRAEIWRGHRWEGELKREIPYQDSGLGGIKQE